MDHILPFQYSQNQIYLKDRPKFWNLLPHEVKSSSSVNTFKGPFRHFLRNIHKLKNSISSLLTLRVLIFFTFLYNICADFPFLSFAVFKTYIFAGWCKSGCEYGRCFVSVYIVNLFLCVFCKGGTTLFQSSPLCYISSIYCVFYCFLNCCF